MIHIYKHGGDWVRNDIEYTVKVVSLKRLQDYLERGWVRTFAELESHSENVDGGDRERVLRSEIKRMSGKNAGPASSMKTLENKYSELLEAENVYETAADQ